MVDFLMQMAPFAGFVMLNMAIGHKLKNCHGA